jgi:hypothetical protein
MSDTFDHEGDAWEDYDRRFDDADCSRTSQGSFTRNSLFYHQKVRFIRITAETEKAVQLELTDLHLVWVPKSVCRNWQESSVWVHKETFKRSMKSAIKPSNEMPTDRWE